MRSIIFAEEQHDNNIDGLVRLSCAVPATWIPRIDEAWKQTRFNNRSEFIRAGILRELNELEMLAENEKKLGKMIKFDNYDNSKS